MRAVLHCASTLRVLASVPCCKMGWGNLMRRSDAKQCLLKKSPDQKAAVPPGGCNLFQFSHFKISLFVRLKFLICKMFLGCFACLKSVSWLCGLLLALENLLVVRVAGFCLCFSERQVMGWMKNSILKKEEKETLLLPFLEWAELQVDYFNER